METWRGAISRQDPSANVEGRMDAWPNRDVLRRSAEHGRIIIPASFLANPDKIKITPECGRSTKNQPIVVHHTPDQDSLTYVVVPYLVKATPDTTKAPWPQASQA
jgi:hypothetical protein